MLTVDTTAQPSRTSEADAALPLEAVFAAVLPAWLAHQGDPMALKDPVTGRYLYVNAEMGTLLQRSPASIVGSSDNDLFDSTTATNFRSADLAAQGSATPLVSDHRFEWAGLRRDYSVWRMVLELPGRHVLCSIWRDQGAQRLKEAQLRTALEQLEREQRANETLRREIKDQGSRDTPAGLYTRAHFEDQLRREVDLSMREHREFSLVLIEVDPWGDAVRRVGPAAEQKVLESVGRLLRSNTRAMDASCHLEGSRFAVLLSGVGLATAHGRMEQLRRQCATQIVMLDAQELRFTVSIGVASFPHTAHTRDELTLACEQAVTQACARGNHVSLASIRFEDS